MSAVSTEISEAVKLPLPVARRGITEAQWRTLANNLYPGAHSDSVLMVWDYCVSRKLDPMKKPCHIVPMQVKDAKTGQYNWRDVVMPGIYEYRTTATRTGLYLGHSTPVYGPITTYLGVSAPEYCEITVYRWNSEAKMRAEYPVQLLFSECVATKKNKTTGQLEVNSRWTVAPQQMLTKCTEAAALREAFPDELGGTHTAEEMDGQVIDVTPEKKAPDPRGDVSQVDSDIVNKYVGQVTDVLAQDKDENAIAADLREVDADMQKFQEVYIVTCDELAKRGIIAKKAYKDYLKIGLEPQGRVHG